VGADRRRVDRLSAALYLIQGRGLSPARAGLILTAQPLVMAIVAPLSGTLSDRIGSRLLGTLGMGILAVGLFLLARLNATSPVQQVAASLAVAGLGTGIFISPNNSALMGAAPPGRQGIASGILATARNVGMVLGVGLAGAIFTSVLAGAGGGAGSALASAGSAPIFAATRASFLAAMCVAVVGALVSATRGAPESGAVQRMKPSI
jgi:MFS family permease